MEFGDITLIFILIGEAVGLLVLRDMRKRIENIDNRLERQETTEA
jgi:hypothetical protein